VLGPPVDAWYVWLGLTVASAALLGATLQLPTAAPPDPEPVARTVDAVAAGPHPGTAVHPLDAEAVRLGPVSLGLRTDAGSAHAALDYGPVTPVPPDAGRLRAVLTGDRPSHRFDSPAALADRVEAVRGRPPDWRPAPDRLLVRRVTWVGVDVTLVG
jgi:hypothetical protein